MFAPFSHDSSGFKAEICEYHTFCGKGEDHSVSFSIILSLAFRQGRLRNYDTPRSRLSRSTLRFRATFGLMQGTRNCVVTRLEAPRG